LRKTVSIVGGGAAALMVACELDSKKFDITLYEKNKQPARKFLVAGDGGFNLTHSENEAKFISRYTPSFFLQSAFAHFSNKHLVNWLTQLGIETFVGSSGRVFPLKGIKPIDVLDTFLQRIKNNSAQLKTSHEWIGFSKERNLVFKNLQQIIEVKSDLVIFCLGGGSWSVTGSNKEWMKYFMEQSILCHPFEASNCAFKVSWPKNFIESVSGKALKNIKIQCENKTHAGEVVLTNFGLEGSGIYPFSPEIRSQLKKEGQAKISIDLKPDLSADSILQKLEIHGDKKNLSEKLKHHLHFSGTQIKLLKAFLNKEDFTDVKHLVSRIKKFEITITGLADVEEAISTIGGIDLIEIDENYELKKLPQHFCIGEMLNYDAPTGGYLLQSCFSMAHFLATHLNNQVG
jgi:uncharacterized flavoprotein (TIGR03862 family)